MKRYANTWTKQQVNDEKHLWLQRCQQLIQAAFDACQQKLAGPLAACLAEAGTAPAAPPGGYEAAQWPSTAAVASLQTLLPASHHAALSRPVRSADAAPGQGPVHT